MRAAFILLAIFIVILVSGCTGTSSGVQTPQPFEEDADALDEAETLSDEAGTLSGVRAIPPQPEGSQVLLQFSSEAQTAVNLVAFVDGEEVFRGSPSSPFLSGISEGEVKDVLVTTTNESFILEVQELSSGLSTEATVSPADGKVIVSTFWDIEEMPNGFTVDQFDADGFVQRLSE